MDWEQTGLPQGLNAEQKFEAIRVFDEMLPCLMERKDKNLINIALPIARRLIKVKSNINGKELILDLESYIKNNPLPESMEEEVLYCENYVIQTTKLN